MSDNYNENKNDKENKMDWKEKIALVFVALFMIGAVIYVYLSMIQEPFRISFDVKGQYSSINDGIVLKFNSNKLRYKNYPFIAVDDGKLRMVADSNPKTYKEYKMDIPKNEWTRVDLYIRKNRVRFSVFGDNYNTKRKIAPYIPEYEDLIIHNENKLIKNIQIYSLKGTGSA